MDFFLEPIIARNTLRPLFSDPKFVRFFIGRENFCLGCLFGLLLYPIIKLVKIIRFFVHFKRFIHTFYFWFYKGYLIYKVHQELPKEWLEDPTVMIELAKDIDSWLSSSSCTSLVNQQAIEIFLSLRKMRNYLCLGDKIIEMV